MENIIHHITYLTEWQDAQAAGEYRPRRFAKDGFIHCSYAGQVVRIANGMFKGCHGLVLLTIDRDLLPCEVKDENLQGGTDLFPHIYGLLPVTAVTGCIPFPPGPDGTFTLPAAVP
jgi:uncharacterized protein (DUF952 family)